MTRASAEYKQKAMQELKDYLAVHGKPPFANSKLGQKIRYGFGCSAYVLAINLTGGDKR